MKQPPAPTRVSARILARAKPTIATPIEPRITQATACLRTESANQTEMKSMARKAQTTTTTAVVDNSSGGNSIKRCSKRLVRESPCIIAGTTAASSSSLSMLVQTRCCSYLPQQQKHPQQQQQNHVNRSRVASSSSSTVQPESVNRYSQYCSTNEIALSTATANATVNAQF